MKITEYKFIVDEDKQAYPFKTPMEDGIVYVSEENKTAVFKCPCGCERNIWLNINEDAEHPRWQLKGNSISPSVNCVNLPCKSHFFITNGKVC